MVPPPRWGWHQLDPLWAKRLVDAAGMGRGDWVVDIGAGLGALTIPLVATGAHVIAVEAHPERARFLRERFGSAVVVVQADAADLRLPRRPFHVVANSPFATTAAVLRRLLQTRSRLVSAHLVLQDQAARRWAAPAAPGRVRWSSTFDVTTGWSVPRSAFRPRPPVRARVLVVRRRPGQ